MEGRTIHSDTDAPAIYAMICISTPSFVPSMFPPLWISICVLSSRTCSQSRAVFLSCSLTLSPSPSHGFHVNGSCSQRLPRSLPRSLALRRLRNRQRAEAAHTCFCGAPLGNACVLCCCVRACNEKCDGEGSLRRLMSPLTTPCRSGTSAFDRKDPARWELPTDVLLDSGGRTKAARSLLKAGPRFERNRWTAPVLGVDGNQEMW